jgi:adenylate cyclase
MRKILLLTLFAITGISLKAQSNTDSLLTVWNNQTQADTCRLIAINEYLTNYSDRSSDLYLSFVNQMQVLATESNSQKHIGLALYLEGRNYLDKNDFNLALKLFKKSLKFLVEINDKKSESLILNSIGIIYRRIGDTNKSIQFFEKALSINQQIEDTNKEADLLLNIGVILADIGEIKRSMEYQLIALDLFEKVGDEVGVVYALSNLGYSYLELDSADKALDLFKRAFDKNQLVADEWMEMDINLGFGKAYLSQRDEVKGLIYINLSLEGARELSHLFSEGSIYSEFGIIYLKFKEYDKAIKWCENGLEIGKRLKSQYLISSNCDCLYKSYRGLNEGLNALKYHDLFVIAQDSVDAEEAKNKLFQFEVEKEQLQDSLNYEGKLLNMKLEHTEAAAKSDKQRTLIIYTSIGILLLAGGLLARLRHINKSKSIIEKEKKRSDELLLNILPSEIAQELKDNGKVGSKRIESVTVIFTDFKGFTAMSELVGPKELVEDLDTCFSEFDRIMEKYGIEKIKTIGDAYMAAGGLPLPDEQHAENVIKAAFEMRDFVEAGKAQKIKDSLPFFEIRIGVHTGPVIAGIVGVKKFQYDIWGDTVNTASRMESSGAVGMVNISQRTYELLKENPDFSFDSRGKVAAKGKGELDMYFVSETH